ncbi:MAG: putative aromatic acid decarboxylase [Pelotomaculum sp. PtaU1.Bin065]|nr:MAG: putative aromatic acid decarboxylase [Pelotomaculum sp. PtaU1.Bin065]
MKRIVVGISGATGAIYGVRLLKLLREQKDVEVHLVMSDWAAKNLELETAYSTAEVLAMADKSYNFNDMGAAISSGSFLNSGMIIMPCSMKSLSAIANGFDANLLVRAANVMLKEQRKLVLCPRETPLNAIHLENMLKLSRLGVMISPPFPAFYNHPHSIMDIVDHQVMKVLDQFGVHCMNQRRWNG